MSAEKARVAAAFENAKRFVHQMAQRDFSILDHRPTLPRNCDMLRLCHNPLLRTLVDSHRQHVDDMVEPGSQEI